MTRDQLDTALRFGQPGSLERLAYWLDLDIRGPSDEHAHAVLCEHLELGGHIDPRGFIGQFLDSEDEDPLLCGEF